MQRLRSILVVALLAMYGAISLFGPALHSLPGLAHAPSTSTPAQQFAEGQLDRGTASSTDHCPVCQFLAQGQLPTELLDVSWTFQATPQSDGESSVVKPAARYQPAHPRAPPVTSADIS
jgi:hypothetical protein